MASTRRSAATLLACRRRSPRPRPGDGLRSRRRPRPAKRGDAAGVDDALDAGAQRFHHDKPRALDIVADDLFGVSRPETIVGRGVKEESNAPERRRQRGGIAEVALAHSVARIEILRARARSAHQRLHVVPARAQLSGNRRSEKAAGAGDKDGRRRRRLGRAPRRGVCECVVGRSAVRRSDTFDVCLNCLSGIAVRRHIGTGGTGFCRPASSLFQRVK